MTVLMPHQLVKSYRRKAARSAVRVRSPFTGAAQTQDWGGEWWEYTLEFDIHVQREGPRMAAFFAKIGRSPFLFRDPAFQTSAAGAPVVSGTGQTGYALTTSGWPVSTTVLRAGDAIQIGTLLQTRMHILTDDAVSNAGGIAVLPIWPALRYSPANGQAVVVSQPAVLLQVTEDVEIDVSRAAIHQFSVTAVEAI